MMDTRKGACRGKDNIKISVPAEKNAFYTIYAEGVSYGAYLRPSRREYDVFLDSRYPIILYFTVRNHRRAFVCASPDLMESNIHAFACTEAPLSVIAFLHGRAFDRFKRSLSYLCKYTENRCHEFGIPFYWQLSYLAKNGLNSTMNLRLLAEKYDAERNLALSYTEENA